VNTTASIILPSAGLVKLNSGQNPVINLKAGQKGGDDLVMEVGSGTYHYQYSYVPQQPCKSPEAKKDVDFF